MINYTDFVKDVIADIAKTVPDFSHLKPDQIAVASTTRWAGETHGLLATCIGLAPIDRPSFSVWVRRGTRNVIAVSPWYIHRPAEIYMHGKKGLYLILLRMPRLLQSNPLETLVHELFHISERFNGRLREMRHGKAFDRRVRALTHEWLANGDPELAAVAQMRFTQLRADRGPVVSDCLPTRFQPSLILPVDPPQSYEDALERIYPGHKLMADFRVRPVRFTPESAPRRIDEKDLTLRFYNTQGAQTIPRVFARYLARRSDASLI